MSSGSIPDRSRAIAGFLDAGGGVLIALGDKVDAAFANATLYQDGAGWLPARLGATKGDAGRRQTIAHPAPRTFIGPALAPLGQGESPPLAGADLFEYRVLEPAKDASVTARLDTGDPWIVERPFGRGRVAIVAGPIDAEGGTLPVNPDFVPWAHELIYHLASALHGRRTRHDPGEPIVIDLDPVPPAGVDEPASDHSRRGSRRRPRSFDPRGKRRPGSTTRPSRESTRSHLPDPPGGLAFATVAADGRESDLRPLEPAEAKALARDLPLTFETDPDRLTGRMFARRPGEPARDLALPRPGHARPASAWKSG